MHTGIIFDGNKSVRVWCLHFMVYLCITLPFTIAISCFFLGLLGKYVRFCIRSFCFRCQSEYCTIGKLNTQNTPAVMWQYWIRTLNYWRRMKMIYLEWQASRIWNRRPYAQQPLNHDQHCALWRYSVFSFKIYIGNTQKNEIYNGNVINMLVLSF